MGIPGLLAALTAAISGQGIRLTPQDSRVTAGGGQRGARAVSLLGMDDGSAAVPKLGVFRQEWQRRMASEEYLETAGLIPDPPRPDRLAVVAGVFSRVGSEDRPFREVVRSTWMARPYICTLKQRSGPEEGCLMYVTFVVGKNGTVPDDEDVTVLPIRENMDCGKSPAWFRYASTTYRWATHIIKMDMDAFPYVPTLVAAIRDFPTGCQNLYGGRTRLPRYWEPNPALRKRPIGGDFLKCGTKGCWSYMQGGLYLLSAELARNASRPGGWWQEASKKCHSEDVTAGQAIHKYAMVNGICVGALQIKVGKEFWHPV